MFQLNFIYNIIFYIINFILQYYDHIFQDVVNLLQLLFHFDLHLDE